MLATREEIHRRVDSLPQDKLPFLGDILALISGEVLTSCSPEVLECVLMSGSALAPELNTPEEDEAWTFLNEGI